MAGTLLPVFGQCEPALRASLGLSPSATPACGPVRGPSWHVLCVPRWHGDRSATRGAGSELHVEFFELVGLLHRGFAPFDHFRQSHDPVAIRNAVIVEMHVVTDEARD